MSIGRINAPSLVPNGSCAGPRALPVGERREEWARFSRMAPASGFATALRAMVRAIREGEHSHVAAHPLDRFNLVIDVIDRVPSLQSKAAHLKEQMKNEIILNLAYGREHGTDRPEIVGWVWPY